MDKKPSWLSWINLILLLGIFCFYFGIIDPNVFTSDIYNKLRVKIETPITLLEERVEKLEKEDGGNKYQNFVSKEEFNKYQYLLNDLNNKVYSILNSINELQKCTNISKEIDYWKDKIRSINNRNCGFSNHPEFQKCENKKESDLKEATEILFKLQLASAKNCN